MHLQSNGNVQSQPRAQCVAKVGKQYALQKQAGSLKVARGRVVEEDVGNLERRKVRVNTRAGDRHEEGGRTLSDICSRSSSEIQLSRLWAAWRYRSCVNA